VLADGSPQDTGYGIATPSPLSGQRVGRQDRSPDRFTSAAPRGMLLMAFLIAAPKSQVRSGPMKPPTSAQFARSGAFFFLDCANRPNGRWCARHECYSAGEASIVQCFASAALRSSRRFARAVLRSSWYAMALTTNPPVASLARVISSLSCLSRAEAILVRSVMLWQSRKSYFPGAAYGDITSLPAQPDTRPATQIAASLRP
jgi:hypothetical protein